MAFAAGDKAWMVVDGEPSEGGGLHEVEIAEVRGEKVLVTREAHDGGRFGNVINPDPHNPIKARHFRAITRADNLELNMDETATKKSTLKSFAEDPENGEGNGEATVYRMDATYPVEDGVNDMVLMQQLNNAELARNLRVKYDNRTGYVRCGPTLVALNMMKSYNTPDFPEGPFDPGLYERFYNMKDRDSESPHCYSLASHCYQQAFKSFTAVHTHADQAMIITGESGAGKTFTTKQILDYLAWVGSGKGQDVELAKLTDKMLSTTPILEGFGNANMPRNPDSSRFGKLYRIYFDRKSQLLTGCSITPYMLEKSRVSSQQQGERNFHMFYRMLCAPKDIMTTFEVTKQHADRQQETADKILTRKMTLDQKQFFWESGGKRMVGLHPDKRAMCKLGAFEDYVYLNGGTSMMGSDYQRIYHDIPDQERNFDDAYHMSHTMAALSGFFTEAQIDTILKTTAGVLHLGNVKILGDRDECKGVDRSGASGQALSDAAELWGVDEDALAKACCMVTISAGGGRTQQIMCNRNGAEGAIILRDTVARMVYDHLFVWIVGKCSEKLQESQTDAGKMGGDVFLGVLDIFGFEFYENHQIRPIGTAVVNGLDQLNINICNEMLQQQFVKVIFGLELATYNGQNIPFTFDDYEDNKPACEFLSKSRGPLLSALRTPAEQRKFGKDGDEIFLREMKKMAERNHQIADNRSRYNGDTVMLKFQERGQKPFKGMDGGLYGATSDRPKNQWKKDVDAINASFVDRGAGSSPAFGIKHYAAEVAYDCRGWLQKDKSTPSEEMAACLQASADKDFLAPVFGADLDASKPGVTAAFCASLTELLSTLDHCDMNFVRCLKTSNPLFRETFESARVLKQLQYTGMLDTLNIRRFGFPQRLTNQDFVDWALILVKDPDHPNDLVLIPEDPNGTMADRDAIASQNATLIAPYLQAAWAQRIFDELPATDRADKLFNDQKAQVVVCGSPKDPKDTPLVMMRDWFMRGVNKYRAQILARATAIVQPAVLAAIHTNLKYGRLARESKAIAASLRGLSNRSQYYSDKWEKLQAMARSAMASALRAEIARFEYYAMRATHFEAANRQRTAEMVLAVTQRCKYQELKAKYLVDEVLAKVAAVVSKKKAEIMSEACAANAEAQDVLAHVRATIEQSDRVHAAAPETSNASGETATKTPKLVRYFPLVKRHCSEPPQVPVSDNTVFKFTFNFECKSMADPASH